MLQNKMGDTFRWTRLVSSKWEDAWLERLRGTGDIVVTTLSGSRSARLDVYCTQQRGKALLKQFGGKVSRVDDSHWKAALDRVPKPISIRGKLIIHQQIPPDSSTSGSLVNSPQNEENEPKKRNRQKRNRRSLFIPAEMAFGSGSHATTASCLRMLCDIDPVLIPGWRMLDLGTGSGILAIAACALGAGEVLGIDFDPIAIRIARCNWRRNRTGLKGTPRFENVDVLKNFPVGRYEVVCANLFAELLIKIAPRILQSLSPGGRWIFSGVLVQQMSDVSLAIRRAGFDQLVVRRRGKWMAGFVQKPD
jgi:ribosomal protein L11 methyltransferase